MRASRSTEVLPSQRGEKMRRRRKSISIHPIALALQIMIEYGGHMSSRTKRSRTAALKRCGYYVYCCAPGARMPSGFLIILKYAHR